MNMDNDEDVIFLEDGNAQANAMVDNHIAKSTRKQYLTLAAQIDTHARSKGYEEGMPKPMTMEYAVMFANDVLAQPNNDGSIRSISGVGLFISAIKHVHVNGEPAMQFPPKVAVYFAKYRRGHKRKIAELRNDGVMKVSEGKQQITFASLMIILAETLSMSGDGRYTHLFLTLLWSMFARTASVADIHMQFFGLNCDAITIRLPRHKGDQEGNAFFPKHIYANPYDCKLCAFTALGIHIYTDLMPDMGTRLFQDGVLKSFSNYFTKVLRTYGFEDEFDTDDHGTHSIRKGKSFCIWYC